MAAKIFEVGDVLPATTQLKIYSTNEYFNSQGGIGQIKTDLDSFLLVDYHIDFDVNNIFYINGVNCRYSWSPPFIIIDTSNWSLSKRTVSTTYNLFNNPAEYEALYWEDLNPAPSGFSITFEENGGSTVSELTEQTNLPSPLPTTTKANHVFAGWYYDNLFTQKANAGDELTANVTLYAKWYTPTTWCEDIADAIREKEGSSGNIKHVDFADKISGLDTCIYLTQEEYDLLDPPNENITYIIVEVE